MIIRLLKPLLVGGAIATLVTACSHTAKQSNYYYNAPAQAYSLDLGNMAIKGSPTLKSSCSVKGSSLVAIDSTGNYYKVDAINLLAHPQMRQVKDDQAALLEAIKAYYIQLYRASNAQIDQQLLAAQKVVYLTMQYPSETPSSDSAMGMQTVGMLIKRNNDSLVVIQHLQPKYNADLMQQRLLTLFDSIRIPGSFGTIVTDLEAEDRLPMGYIGIDPTEATAAQVEQWQKLARCQ